MAPLRLPMLPIVMEQRPARRPMPVVIRTCGVCPMCTDHEETELDAYGEPIITGPLEHICAAHDDLTTVRPDEPPPEWCPIREKQQAYGRTHVDGERDTEHPCTDFRNGTPAGTCHGDGHYACDDCTNRATCATGCGYGPDQCVCLWCQGCGNLGNACTCRTPIEPWED